MLDTEPEQPYDDITSIAANICEVPIALISLVDENRQWFKSKVGIDACETSRDVAFCAHALLQPESLMVIPNAAEDPRFSGNPLVTGPPHIRFYAGAPLLSENHQPIGTLCVIDTEPRQLSELQMNSLMALSRQVMTQMQLEKNIKELEFANHELETFAYVASHDLKEPLRTLSSYISLLRKNYKGQIDSDTEDYFSYMTKGVNKLKQLIDDLLSYSRVNTHSSDLKDVDIQNIVDQVLLEYTDLIQRTDAVVNCPKDLPTEKTDRALLTQVFRNLIGNALKYHKNNRPEIGITCVAEGHEWHFSIRDNGIGIDPKYHQQIFEMFKRLHTYEEFSGTGIGLAVCKKIVERLHGRLWVESVEGEGSVFHFTVPKHS